MSDRAPLAAAVLATDPAGLAGVVLRARASPVREEWMQALRGLLPTGAPWCRLPPSVGDAALHGGLDLAATLAAGRPVSSRGIVAAAQGGVLVAPMAERMDVGLAARLAAVLDGESMPPAGASLQQTSTLAVVALDEGVDDERVPAVLCERLALHVVLDDRPGDRTFAAVDVEAARLRLPHVEMPDAVLEALCGGAVALGIASLRAPLLAARAARAHAALMGRDIVEAADAAFAAQHVLGPRATRMPVPPEESAPAEEPPPPAAAEGSGQADDEGNADPRDMGEVVLEAAQVSLPPGLLAGAIADGARRAAGSAGNAGALQASRTRGRPIGARRAPPHAGARLHLLETLRAAAPWQRVRAAEWSRLRDTPPPRLHVRRDDFHVVRHALRRRSTTVFAVDASGSSALHRLSEAKGAVELLLAQCYVRRDEVAVVAFRGTGAQVLLPPTRSLARARRSLAGLPGGGGTPLALGLDAARELAQAARRRGATPVVVVLTDGKANIARDGTPGRERAGQDALAAARLIAADRIDVVLLDTSPQPQATAQALAAAMGGRYVPLPHGGAKAVSAAVLDQ